MARHSLQLRPGPAGPVPDAPLVRLGAVGAVPGSLGVIVGGGTIPYTPEARALKDENAANWLDRDPEVKCYLPGVPRATYIPMPFQIVQSESDFFIKYQFADAVRDIYLDDPGPSPVDSWMGWSVGHWEGDTLVVDVTGQNDRTWLDRAGSHHSAQVHVVERYTPLGPNHIQYEATIEDPVVLTEAVHDSVAALPPDRGQRPRPRLQVRRVCRGVAVWRVAAEPATAIDHWRARCAVTSCAV